MWVSKQRRILCWFRNCWEKCEKFANKKVTAKKNCEKSEVLLFYTTNLQKCLAKNLFLGGFFFDYFHRFEISDKFCEFWILICHKRTKNFLGVIEYIYEYMLELVECRFARNGLTNWKTFLTNIFENIIWHLFGCESHQVVKITVP